MPTNPRPRPEAISVLSEPGTEAAQKVVIVNGSPDIMGLLETTLDAGQYDIVFVESSAHAYSQVKRVRPSLVILCVRLEDKDELQVLSMLKLDQETRHIPILTYATGYDGDDASGAEAEMSRAEGFAPSSARRMN